MSTVDLVGPKGYVHGWRYVGGPGLPSSEPKHDHSGHHAASSAARSAHHTPVAAGATPSHRVKALDLKGNKPESTAGRREALKQGHALPPSKPGGRPGFPVTDPKHWDKALEAVGRTGGGARRRALAKLLRKTAPEFGKSIKGTWVESDLKGAGASMSNDRYRRVLLLDNWVPSKDYWADKGGSDEEKADNHIATAKKAFAGGQHQAAAIHLQRASELTQDSGKQAQISKLKQGVANVAGPSTVVNATQARKLVGMSNATGGYDLAARYRALQFADDGDNDIDDMKSQGKLQCPNCGYRSDDADFQITGKSSGTSDPSKPAALQTPGSVGNQASTGFSPGSAGLNVASKGGSYGSMSNSRRGIELARRQVTSAGDIVVSRGANGAAVIRHRRGGDEIGTIERLASGQWGGRLASGHDLQPHTHQRAALQELIGTWNTGQVTPFRPAMPIQNAPVTPPLMQQLGVSNVRLATPATGASSGARVTGYANGDDDSSDSGSDSGSGGSGPAGLSPKGVTIYKKLIAKGFPPARALAFARNSEKATAGSFQKAS